MDFSPAQCALADDNIVLAIINHCSTYRDYRELCRTSRVFYRVSVQQQHKYTHRDQRNKAAMAEALRLWRIHYVEAAESRLGFAFDEEKAWRDVQYEETTFRAAEILTAARRYAFAHPPPHPYVKTDSIRILARSDLPIVIHYTPRPDGEVMMSLTDANVYYAHDFHTVAMPGWEVA
jgi:hypothetical protein